MNEEQLTTLAAITGAASLGVGIVLMFLMVTLFFRKTVEVERRIATPGKQLDGIRRFWRFCFSSQAGISEHSTSPVAPGLGNLPIAV